MPKSNYSLPHEKIQRELATIKVEVNHIKKQVKDLSTEQKKLSAYANMGKRGYVVEVGNQRLKALLELGITTAPCLVTKRV